MARSFDPLNDVPARVQLSGFLSAACLLRAGIVTAASPPNVFDSDDPETVQIFTGIHEEDLFSVCRPGVCCQVQIQILFIHDWR